MLEVSGFCDSDWGASEDRRSITGYGFQLCSDGPLISWKSRKQQTVALTKCEAEYIALVAGTQEANFILAFSPTEGAGCLKLVALSYWNPGS